MGGEHKQQYQVALDKGTFDAISLATAEDVGLSDVPRNLYVPMVKDLLMDGGLLIITSCNFTKDEVVKHFEGHFTCIDSIKYPVFQFGGKVGSTVSTCILKKK
jgi:hypothetical protein